MDDDTMYICNNCEYEFDQEKYEDADYHCPVCGSKDCEELDD